MTGLSITAAHADSWDWLWSSYFFEVSKGKESRRWTESQYSELIYRQCSGPRSSGGSTPYKTTAQYHRDISAWPDADYDTKTFTNCFGGYMHESRGTWHNLPKGSYYFSVNGVWGGVGKLSVDTVAVDNTAAD